MFTGKLLVTGDTEQNTSPTLLGRLGQSPTDELAWQDFERTYGELIQRWCRGFGMQASDADDVTQDVLLALSKQMHRFRYDPTGRFRSWLKTVVYRAWCDFLQQRKRRRDAGSGDTAVKHLLDSQEVFDDLLQRFEFEWKRELLEEAMRRVRQRVQTHTWEAFRLLTREELSGAEAAERLQMSPGSVWVAKSKVQKMLKQEIRRLESWDHE